MIDPGELTQSARDEASSSSDKRQINVLLIEENPTNAKNVRSMLGYQDAGLFSVKHVSRFIEGLRNLRNEPFDIVLLDLAVSHSQGVESISQIESAAPDVATIVLSDGHDEKLALQAVQAGAQDYLIREQGDQYLMARAIRYAIERKQEKRRLTQLAHYDPLTGLVNRSMFHTQLENAISRSQRTLIPVGLMYLDLDGFKKINDTLGHDVGDMLLQAVATRLQECVRDGDVISRLGGDEFTIILNNLNQIEDAEKVASGVIKALETAFYLDGNDVFVSSSIGIAVHPADGDSQETLIKMADAAMYHAKHNGRNNYQFYSPNIVTQSKEELTLERDLHYALQRNEFVLHYLPQLDLTKEQIVGATALLRWKKDDGDELILPQDFIPVAEETGLIVPIGQWVISTASEHYQQWIQQGLAPITLSINISAQEFKNSELVDFIREKIQSNRMNPSNLELELTESTLLDTISSNETIARLRRLGICVALDGFGTGKSSFDCIRRFQVNTLKIDRSFTHRAEESLSDNVIIESIVNLGHKLGLKVVADGVENEKQFRYLKSIGCDEIQGFHISQPLDFEAMSGYLSDNQK